MPQFLTTAGCLLSDPKGIGIQSWAMTSGMKVMKGVVFDFALSGVRIKNVYSPIFRAP